MKVAPRVTLVIIAYGQPDLLEALLDSIVDHTPEAHEILVVDNASPDDTYERASRHRSQPRLIKAHRNLGYGGGANLGVRASDSDIVIIMNSDLEVTEGWLSPLLRPIETNSAVITAPLYLDETGRPSFLYNLYGHVRTTVAGTGTLTPGPRTIQLLFDYDGGFGKGATITLAVDDAVVAQGRIERSVPVAFSMGGETFDLSLIHI